nr:hypothetical protein [Tanacetum cinerariifolium]
MGIEDIASWDLDNSTWGGWGEVIGTVLERMIPGLGFLINLSFNVNLFLKTLLSDPAFLLISDLVLI